MGGSGLADELIVKENDDELIWQQICMQNKITSKEIRKTLKLFGNDLRIPEEQSVESESENEEEEEDDEVEDEDAEMESEDEPKAKKKRDLFSLRFVFVLKNFCEGELFLGRVISKIWTLN